MMGDIHKRQSFNHKGTVVAYCGSLVQQNFGEKLVGMDFYLGY
jgi:DNA repair exonuclease SbcCD nuclease subunit